jgi:hypothetical protein
MGVLGTLAASAALIVAPSRFCARANRRGFNSIEKARDFSLFARPWVLCS